VPNYGSADVTWFYVDGYQLAGVTFGLEDSQSAETENKLVFGESLDHEDFTGGKSYDVKHDGFFDDDALSVITALDPAVGGKLGVEHLMAYAIAGNAAGRNCVCVRGALEATFKKMIQRGKFTKGSAAYKVNTALDTAKLLAPRAARTTAGNTESASVDNGASSASGGTLYLFGDVLTLGGYTSLSVKLRDAATTPTFADVSGGAFTAVTTAPFCQALAISGTIRRHTAIAWSWNGSGSSPSWTGIVALVRNP
jgi:hypothetical protein